MNSRNKLRLVGVLVAALSWACWRSRCRERERPGPNHDKIPDMRERHHQLSLHKDQARRDQDRDSLKNRKEFKARTNPRDADSDDDGVEDGDENAGTVGHSTGRRSRSTCSTARQSGPGPRTRPRSSARRPVTTTTPVTTTRAKYDDNSGSGDGSGDDALSTCPASHGDDPGDDNSGTATATTTRGMTTTRPSAPRRT